MMDATSTLTCTEPRADCRYGYATVRRFIFSQGIFRTNHGVPYSVGFATRI